jgi:nucleoside-diphosphate-sugar epimerase
MREIICGAGGFLGSNLRKHLESKGKEVIVLPTEMLLDPPDMHVFLKIHEPYHLYYLAAYGNLHGQSDLDEIYRAIIIKFLNLLQATKETMVEAIITAGSTSEYGNKTEPMREDMLLEPDTFYAAAKAGATHLAQAWSIREKAPVVVFRPASMTGVGEQEIHLIPTLIRSCLFGEAMPFVGEAMHDYINVLDVCSAIEILAEKAGEIKGQIFNVGTGVQTSNLIIKEMIEHITGKKANINKAVKVNPQHLSEVWIANSGKMKGMGWKPEWTLYKTLKSMVRAI